MTRGVGVASATAGHIARYHAGRLVDGLPGRCGYRWCARAVRERERERGGSGALSSSCNGREILGDVGWAEARGWQGCNV